MKKRIILTAITLLTVLVVHAQWRIGVTGGIDYNVFSMDKQYMTDYDIDGNSLTNAPVFKLESGTNLPPAFVFVCARPD